MKLNEHFRQICVFPRRGIRGIRTSFTKLKKRFQHSEEEEEVGNSSFSQEVDNISRLKIGDGIPFDELPYGLQCCIYRKFTYDEYVTFDECSVSSHSFSELLPNEKFPLAVQYCKIEGDTAFCKIRKVCKKVNRRFTWNIKEVQNLKLQVHTLHIKELLEENVFSILINTIRKVVVMAYSEYSPFYLEFIKTFQPIESTIEMNWRHDDLNVIWNQQFDHSGVYDVIVTDAFHLRPSQLFAFKAERSLNFKSVAITPDQLYQQFDLWSKGRLSLNFKIDLQWDLSRFHFNMFNFVDLMRAYQTVTIPTRREWVIQRNGAKLCVKEHYESERHVHLSLHQVVAPVGGARRFQRSEVMKLNVLIRKLCTHPRRCIRGLRRRFVTLGKCIQPAQNEADENSILFEKLPYILQCSIYRKFSYAQFAKFDECSTSSHSFRSFPNDKFPLAVNYCDLRYDGAYCTGPTRCFDFGWRDMTQVQNLVLEVDVLDITNLQTPVMFSILKKTIGKVNKIIYQYYSPYYLQIVKKYQPKEVVIKVDWGHPKLQEESYFDYKGVWDVTITNGRKINPPENIFKFKAERSVTVHNSELTHNQLFRRIADWRDGRWSFDYQIDIHCNAFLISDFIQMMRVYETRTTDVGREWTVVRNDATLFVQEHAGCHFSFHTVTE